MIDHFWQKVGFFWPIYHFGEQSLFFIFSCWNVSFFIYHFRGWFSYFWVYHFATQLCFLSTACIILQLNFGFFQSVLKDICELTEGVTLRVHVPAPPQTERMSVGSTRQRASASFIIIILFRAAMTRMYAPILTPRTPAWRAGRMGDPAAPSPTKTIKHILKTNLRTSSRACGALGCRGWIWSSGGGERVGTFRKCLQKLSFCRFTLTHQKLVYHFASSVWLPKTQPIILQIHHFAGLKNRLRRLSFWRSIILQTFFLVFSCVESIILASHHFGG